LIWENSQMICDHANKLTIRSLGPWPEDTLRHAYSHANIRLTTTTAGFGGTRTWFLCSRCDRRCSILYDNPASGWVCRICASGHYASEVEAPIDRMYRRARKLRCRLGQHDPDMTFPFPGKPVGMHWSTYLRLRKEGLALEARLLDHMRRNLPALLRRRMIDQSLSMEAD
jgi:hypothetical protein